MSRSVRRGADGVVALATILLYALHESSSKGHLQHTRKKEISKRIAQLVDGCGSSVMELIKEQSASRTKIPATSEYWSLYCRLLLSKVSINRRARWRE